MTNIHEQVRDLLDGLGDLPDIGEEGRAAVAEIRTLSQQYTKVAGVLQQKADALAAELRDDKSRAYVVVQLATAIQTLAHEYTSVRGQLNIAKGRYRAATGREW